MMKSSRPSRGMPASPEEWRAASALRNRWNLPLAPRAGILSVIIHDPCQDRKRWPQLWVKEGSHDDERRGPIVERQIRVHAFGREHGAIVVNDKECKGLNENFCQASHNDDCVRAESHGSLLAILPRVSHREEHGRMLAAAQGSAGRVRLRSEAAARRRGDDGDGLARRAEPRDAPI